MYSKNKIVTGCLCAIGCEILFGLSYVFTKKVLEMVVTFELLGWRFLIAFIIMSILVLMGVIKVNLKGKNLKSLLMVVLFNPVIYFIGETLTVWQIAGAAIIALGIYIANIKRLLQSDKFLFV